MALVRWNPMRSLMRWPSFWEDEDFLPTFTSDNLDIYETDNEVVVKASVAGVPDDKIEVTFEQGILWIRAEAETETKEGKKYYRQASRNYSYKVAVPGNIDLKKEPQAEIENGVVKVTFKKAEETKPKKIAIKRRSAKVK